MMIFRIFTYFQCLLYKTSLLICKIQSKRQKSNNYQYQFMSIITEKQSCRGIKRRQISFSDLQGNSIINHLNSTPSPSTRNHYSRSKGINASPLHNLHYKYLPENYVSPEKVKQNKEPTKNTYKKSLTRDNSEEIVRINSKIKKILESLEQQEKRKDSYMKKYPKNQSVQRNHHGTKYEYGSEHLIGFTTPLKQKSINQLAQNNYGKQSNMSSAKSQQKQNYSIIRKQYTSKLKHSKQQNEQQSKSHSNSYNLLNSRYLNYSASRVKKLKCEETVVNGKNVDHQIEKIQQKVKELDKLKKSLGPEFQLSKATQKGSEAETNLKQSETKYQSKIIERSSLKGSIQITQRPVKKETASINLQKQVINYKRQQIKGPIIDNENLIKSQLYNIKQNFNEQDVSVPKILRNLPSKRKKACIKTVQDQHNPFLQIQSTVTEFVNTNTQTPQQLQTGRQLNTALKVCDINNAIQKLDDKPLGNQLKRLLFNFQKQIKADQQLRKIKKWFQRLRNQLKWCQLQKCLRKKGLSTSTYTMKQTFSVSSQEQNPFYTPRQTDFQIQDLVNAYMMANKNWIQNIIHNYSRQKLKQCLFIERNIDISKRGCISIEDLVRFINYQLDVFYRNRDMYLIYHRLSGSSTLRFQKLIQALTQQQS